MKNLQLIDNQFLESIKRTIMNCFRKQGYSDTQLEEISRRADGYQIFVTEELGVRMQCRASEKQILIDSSFVNLDSNGKFVGWKTGMAKLIQSQIGHELIHAFSYIDNDKCSGLKRNNSNIDFTAMNEGVTQMITEHSFGYVVSPLTDGYKHYKKIAKILFASFGEDNCIYDDYLFHTNKLGEKCNSFTGNNSFYDLLNARMSCLYRLGKNDIVSMQKSVVFDLLYEELIANIVVPKLQKMQEDDRKKYITQIMESIKDDSSVSHKIYGMIEKYLLLDREKYQQERHSLEQKLVKQDRINSYFMKINQGGLIADYFEIVSTINGRLVVLTKEPPKIVVENQELLEFILANEYRQELGGNDSEDFSSFKEKVEKQLTANSTFTLDCSDINLARKQFCAIKKVAQNLGYRVLTSMSELVQGQMIEVVSIKNPREEKDKLSFETLKKIVSHLDIEQDENNYNDMISVNRKTREKIQIPSLDFMAKFGAMWLDAAGTKRQQNEKIAGLDYAFNSGSEMVFNEILEIAQKNLQEIGTIDAEYIIDKIESFSNYKYAGEIVRKLLGNEWKRNVFVGFLSLITENSLLETQNSENKYGIKLTKMYGQIAEDLVDEM